LASVISGGFLMSRVKMAAARLIILYLGIVFTVVFSIFLAEQTIGRAAQRSPAAVFRRLKRGAWPIIGYIGVLCAVMILLFYSISSAVGR
jgi:NSS family neurotransmitter:Na+ symporter